MKRALKTKGSIAQWLGYVLPDSFALGAIPGTSMKFRRNFDVALLHQQCCWLNVREHQRLPQKSLKAINIEWKDTTAMDSNL